MPDKKSNWGSIVLRFIFVVTVLITTAAALYPNFKLSALFSGIQVHDAFVHMMAFTVITIIAAGAWQPNAWIVVQIVLFALALELAQSFAPGREVSLVDAVFSLGGIMTGLSIFVMSMYFRRNFLSWI